MWLLADPLDELAHARVPFQSFERVVLPFELLVVKDGVYVPMAGRTQIHRVVNLSPVENLLVSLIFMACLGDEMVAGQPPYRPAAQATGSVLCAAVNLAHSSNSTIAGIE